MSAISRASKLSTRNPRAAVAASPASFQPLKAHTSTGLRSSGRSRQRTLSIHSHGNRAVPSVHPITVPAVRLGPQYCGVSSVASQRMTVARLRVGSPIQGVFACTRKDRMTAKTGSSYLAVELRDRTGTIAARAFRDADFLAGRFERGDLVRVSGRVGRFRDELQVDLRDIQRVDDGSADPADFLPVAYRDMEELDGFLEHLAREVYDPAYRALLDSFLEDERFRADFRRAPCSRAGHHAYLGGLIEHTVAVATLAHETCTLHPRLNSDLLLTAALLHDIGKTREFSLGSDIALS